MILLITSKEDVTTDFIVDKLNEKKLLYYRLNTEEFFKSIESSFSIIAENTIFDKQKDLKIDLSEIRSVYFRRPVLPKIEGIMSLGEKKFITSELKFFLNGFYSLLSNCFWVSRVNSISNAEDKIKQLLLAKDIGFTIPKTIISNRSEDIIAFVSRHERCIIKAIKTGFIEDEDTTKIIFSSSFNEISQEDAMRIKVLPVLLQEEIKKVADIRVTVVGKNIFAAKINSQLHDDTKVDWRAGDFPLDHEKIFLPTNVSEKCIELVKRLDLVFGAIDLVLTSDNKYVFLEINPNGQWGWIENRLGYKISDEIINQLVHHGN